MNRHIKAALLSCAVFWLLVAADDCDDSIYDLQNDLVAVDSSVNLQNVVVTTPIKRATGGGFYVQEPDGGPFSGLYVWYGDAPDFPNVSPGFVVNIEGTYTEYYGLAEVLVAQASDMRILEKGDAPQPVTLDPADVAIGGPLAEDYEGVLIRVENVSVIAAPDNFGEFQVTGGLHVDDMFYEPIGDIQPDVGTNFDAITGVLHYSYGQFKLEPRYHEDYILSSSTSNAYLTATFIDVGQGDAALFELPGGETILIDGGKSGSGEEIINPILDQKGISVIDLMVLTHAHADHCGGLDEVLEHVKVLEIWDNGEGSDTSTYEDYEAARDAEGATLRHPAQGYMRSFGDVILEVLNTEEGYTELNNDSIVIMMSYGAENILMTGDIEHEEQEDEVLDYGEELACKILKVPHHGSANFDPSFVQATSPDFAIISVGEDNVYDDPSPDLVNAYETAGATVCRTDEYGTIIAATNGSSLEVTCSIPDDG